MKNLIILHIGGKNNLEKVLKQHKTLKLLCDSLNSESDTYIYFNDLNCGFEGKFFSGNVYSQEIDVLSPSIISDEILALKKIRDYNKIIIAEDDYGSDLAVLLAAKLKYNCLTNVQNISFSDNDAILTKFSYNNNLLVDYKISGNSVINLRGYKNIDIKKSDEKVNLITIKSCNKYEKIINTKIVKEAEDLVESRILIAVGMGVNSKNEIDRIRKLSLNNGFSFGVTRPVAMRGWGSLSEIIGVSGNIFSPKICITIGVSGAAAFYVGIENSEYILSVNIDEDASIIPLSNTNIIDDYKNVINNLFLFLQNYKS